jgi:hypothetical protein
MVNQIDLRRFLYLKESFGTLHWCENQGGKRRDAVAGTLRKDGYIQIKLNGKLYLAHRLIWLYMHGEWPPEEVDHRNGDRSDNRPPNLRLASRVQNAANYRKPKTNTSGVKGVAFHKATGKWQAHIRCDNKQIYLGVFDTIEFAEVARVLASRRYHGQFERIE